MLAPSMPLRAGRSTSTFPARNRVAHLPARSSCALGVAILISWLAPFEASGANFEAPVELEVVGSPTSVVVLDLNEDQILDLAVNGPDLQRLVVYLGTPGGGVGSRTNVGTAPWQLSDLVAIDVDRDGRLDIVGVDGLRGDVVTFRQTPGAIGDLFSVSQIEGIEEATAVEALDRDLDGWTDVVVALHGGDEFVWYRNDLGTLTDWERVPTGDGPRALDFARGADGVTRLVVLHDGYLSRDVAGFELGALDAFDRWPLERPLGVIAGDLEKDGVDEILVTDGEGEVVVLAAEAGVFVQQSRFPVRPESPWAIPVARAADAARVLVAETGRGRLSLFEDPGTGFTSDRAWFVSRNISSPAFEDLDGDGFRELLLPLPEEDLLLVVDTLGEGYLIPDAVETLTRPRRVEVTDVDDPFPRVVSLSDFDDMARVHRIVDARLEFLEDVATPPDPDEMRWFDLDGVNGMDLLLLDRMLGLFVALTQPDGSLGALESLYASDALVDFDAGEVYGTAGPEIVVADTSIEGIRVLAETSPGVWTSVAESPVGQEPVVVRLEDLDLNGFEDPVVLSTVDRMTLVFMDADEILFNRPFSTALSPRDVGFGNFNDDGFPDIALATAGASTFSLFTTLFRGGYALTDANNAAPFGAQSLEVADFTGDGIDDVLVGSPSETSLSLHPVSSFGQAFQSEQPVRVCEQPVWFRVAQIDGDGEPDIVAIDRESDVVVTVRSDPFSLLPTITGSISATVVGNEATIRVTSDARVADEFAVLRVPDLRPVPVRWVASGQWEGLDAQSPGVGTEYLLRNRRGIELARATASDLGAATSVPDEPIGPVVEAPELRDGTVTVRFRTGGNQRPTARVHDVRGRTVGRVDVVTAGGGWFEGRWDGRDRNGRRLARGRYFVYIQSPDARLSTPVTLR